VRGSAAFALGELKDKRALSVLEAALEGSDDRLGADVACALSEFGAAALPVLARALKSPNKRVRELAAYGLGRIRDAGASNRAESLLRDVLRDDDWEVRRNAAMGLVDLGGGESVGPLIETLTDPSEYVAGWAASALGRIGDKRAVPALLNALTNVSEHVRESVAFALQHLRDPASVPALIRALEDKSGKVRERVVYALREIGTPDALDALQHHL